jgi:hypothetical protein
LAKCQRRALQNLDYQLYKKLGVRISNAQLNINSMQNLTPEQLEYMISYVSADLKSKEQSLQQAIQCSNDPNNSARIGWKGQVPKIQKDILLLTDLQFKLRQAL